MGHDGAAPGEEAYGRTTRAAARLHAERREPESLRRFAAGPLTRLGTFAQRARTEVRTASVAKSPGNPEASKQYCENERRVSAAAVPAEPCFSRAAEQAASTTKSMRSDVLIFRNLFWQN